MLLRRTIEGVQKIMNRTEDITLSEFIKYLMKAKKRKRKLSKTDTISVDKKKKKRKKKKQEKKVT